MEELARIALVGTSRLASAPAADAQDPCDALVAALGDEDRERGFLLRAGVRAVYEECGRVARPEVSVPEASPRESRPVAAQKTVGLLRNAIASQSWDLLAEFLRQLEATGLVLPPELLPEVLDLSDAAVRERLLPVLGERGRWLSEFNPDWAWVTESVATLSARDRGSLMRGWDEGNFSQRCQVLETLRRSAPEEARSLVESAIEKEKPDHRSRLLEALRIGLGAGDEPLLESRLDDRAEQVRRTAAALLARLPGSALARRMEDRASAMLMAAGSGAKLRVHCSPPQEIDKTWVRDGVPAKPPPGRGKRAVWAEAVLAAVPPSRWSQRFAAEPSQLIEAVRQSDFAQPVLVGWSLATAAFARDDDASAAWLRPLWDYWADGSKHASGQGQAEAAEHLTALFSAMSREDAEAVTLPMLAQAASAQSLVAHKLLVLIQRPWGAEFSRAYLAACREVLRSRTDNLAYQWSVSLFVAGRALPRELFAEALEPWEVAEGKGQWHSDAARREIEKFTDTIRLRQSFCNELLRP